MTKLKWSNLSIDPWVGDAYPIGYFKKTLLVVGESEYQTREGQKEAKSDVIWCVRRFIKGLTADDKCSKKFYSNITTLLLGRSAETREERAQVWHSLAFHNYIQRQVGWSASASATPKMWKQEQAQLAFREVLEKLNPEVVIVLGFGNWNYMVRADADGPRVAARPPQNSTRNDVRDLCWFRTGTGRALAICVKHPSRAFNAQIWHAWLRSAMPQLFRGRNS